MGMVGGGPGAFIGAVHRIAASMDGQIELVCGAFSSHPEKSRKTGEELMLDPNRVYGSYDEMMEKESRLSQEERMDFVSIVTPNHVHFGPAKSALEHGFHVVIDKPITFDLDEARKLSELVKKTGLLLCLTHTYTGYPMVKQARQMVREGLIGKIRKIYVEYPQGWLSTPKEKKGDIQAAWRTDPAKSGIAGAIGDIGTHAANMAEYVSGLRITQICANINVVFPGRQLDDDGDILLRFENGSSGVLMVSQIATGEENCIKFRIYGEKAGLEWKQDDANSLLVKWIDKPVEILRTGGPNTFPFVAHYQRTPAGHPEGYLEAFANIYKNFALCLLARLDQVEPDPEWKDFPDVEDGVRGMLFIEKAIESGKSDKKWIDL